MSLADKFGFGPKRVVSTDGNGLYRIDVTPPVFMKLPTQSLILDEDQFQRYRLWLSGKLIQDVLPDLTVSQREILMTGLGDEDFHRIARDNDNE